MSFLKCVVVLVIFGRCHANVYDCNADPSGQPEHISVKETDPIGTVLATFNNSYGDLTWTASSNGTNREYLSQFFKSAESEGDALEHMLQLAKILDLELLELELVSVDEMFTSSQATTFTIDLIVRCNQQDNHEKKELIFRVEILSVNEFYPQFIGAPFTTVISEATEIGSEILNLGSRATDLDAGQTNLTFAIAPYMITQFDGSRFVRMDETGKGRILLQWPLDFESFLNTGRTFMFINVTVSDDGGLTSSTSINVTVTDANDQGIQFIYPGCARPCIQANYTVTTNESYVGLLQVQPASVKAADLDTLNESVVYRITSDMDIPFLSMNKVTGDLYKTTPLVNDSLGYEIIIGVRVQESSDENHFLDTNITVFISDRRPKPAKHHQGDHAAYLQRLERLEKLHRETQSKIADLESTVARQGRQLESQHQLITSLRSHVQQLNKKVTVNGQRFHKLSEYCSQLGVFDNKEKVKTNEAKHNIVSGSDVKDTVSDKRHGNESPERKNQRIQMRDSVWPNDLHIRQERNGVSFSVYLDHDVDLGYRQTLKFNQVITNEGNGYNVHSGVFTCPQSGMYLFSFFVGQRQESSSSVSIYLELLVNSQRVVNAAVDAFHATQDLQGGNTVVIRLKQGDVVWIECSDSGGSHAEGSSSFRLTTFTGVFIHP